MPELFSCIVMPLPGLLGACTGCPVAAIPAHLSWQVVPTKREPPPPIICLFLGVWAGPSHFSHAQTLPESLHCFEQYVCRRRTRAVGGTARIPAMWLCPALRSDSSSPGLHGRLYIYIYIYISPIILLSIHSSQLRGLLSKNMHMADCVISRLLGDDIRGT